MNTVADLILYLQTLDQNTKVEVVVHSDGHTYYDQGGNARTCPFAPEHTEHNTLADGTKELLLGRYRS